MTKPTYEELEAAIERANEQIKRMQLIREHNQQAYEELEAEVERLKILTLDRKEWQEVSQKNCEKLQELTALCMAQEKKIKELERLVEKA